MGFLDQIKNKNQKEEVKTPKKANFKAADGKKKTKSNSEEKPSGRGKLVNKNRNPDKVAIIKRDKVPSFVNVLSNERGKIPISSEELRKDFIILLASDEKKEAILLESIEGSKENRDHAMKSMDIRQRVRVNKYSITTMLASRDIIRILYDEFANANNGNDEAKSSELQQDFDELVRSAVNFGTSDIHIEVRRTNAKIRFRKNGQLQDFKEIPVNYAKEFARCHLPRNCRGKGCYLPA